MHSNELIPIPPEHRAPPADQLRLAVAAYLARFQGSSRDHAHSDLRCYLAWCADRGLDPLAATRPGAAAGGQGHAAPACDTPNYRLNAAGWTVDRPNRIFVVAADGSSAPRTVTPGPFQADGLAWSPDGSKIAFTSARHDTWDLDLANDLWVVRVDGTSEPERRAGRRLAPSAVMTGISYSGARDPGRGSLSSGTRPRPR